MTITLDNQSLEDAYKYTDDLFNSWFSNRKDYDLAHITELFPNLVMFTPTTLFACMYWLFLNFPMDYLASKNSRVGGKHIFKHLNLLKVDCVLEKMELSVKQRTKIIKLLVSDNYYGNPKWIDVIKDKIQVNPVDIVIQKYGTLHPLYAVREWLSIRNKIPKDVDEQDRVMAINLSLALTHVENVAERENQEKQELLEKQQAELLAYNKKLAERDRLINETPSILFFSAPGSDVEKEPVEVFVPYDPKMWGY